MLFGQIMHYAWEEPGNEANFHLTIPQSEYSVVSFTQSLPTSLTHILTWPTIGHCPTVL